MSQILEVNVILCECLVPSSVKMSEHEVIWCLLCVNLGVTRGPGELGGRVLKFCARQLGPMFAQPVKVLLNLHVVPRSWKTSTISLVPKKKKVLELW